MLAVSGDRCESTRHTLCPSRLLQPVLSPGNHATASVNASVSDHDREDARIDSMIAPSTQDTDDNAATGRPGTTG
jgi:hypothetical protein